MVLIERNQIKQDRKREKTVWFAFVHDTVFVIILIVVLEARATLIMFIWIDADNDCDDKGYVKFSKCLFWSN